MNAAVLLSVRQVAEALADRGAVRASVSLLAALAQDALAEGWLSLAAGLLYHLLEVSAPLATVLTLQTLRFCYCAEKPTGITRSFAIMFGLFTMYPCTIDKGHLSAAPRCSAAREEAHPSDLGISSQ